MVKTSLDSSASPQQQATHMGSSLHSPTPTVPGDSLEVTPVSFITLGSLEPPAQGQKEWGIMQLCDPLSPSSLVNKRAV